MGKQNLTLPTWEVTVIDSVVLPGRPCSEFHRIFSVQVNTRAQAVRAVKDAGYRGKIVRTVKL